jgi:hypothetical protein
VPQFIVYLDLDIVDEESSIIKCKVLQHHPQEEGPPDVDPIPENAKQRLQFLSISLA